MTNTNVVLEMVTGNSYAVGFLEDPNLASEAGAVWM